MGEPFLGSEAIRSGRLTPHAVRTRCVALHRDVYLPRGTELTPLVRACLLVVDGAERNSCRPLGIRVIRRTVGGFGAQRRGDPRQSASTAGNHHLVGGYLTRRDLRGRWHAGHYCGSHRPRPCLPPSPGTGGGRDRCAVPRDRAQDLRDVRARIQAWRDAWNPPGACCLRSGGRRCAVAQGDLAAAIASRCRASTRDHPDLGAQRRFRGVEYDGDQHRSDRRQYRKDITRLEMLDGLGWLIVRVVAEDHLDDIIRRVRDALARRQ